MDEELGIFWDRLSLQGIGTSVFIEGSYVIMRTSGSGSSDLRKSQECVDVLTGRLVLLKLTIIMRAIK